MASGPRYLKLRHHTWFYQIGVPADVADLRERRVALTLFLVGAFVIIGLYHISLWWARRQETSPLFFAGVCFAIVLRLLTVDDIFLTTLLPGLPWEWIVRFEYASLPLISAAFGGVSLIAIFS